MKILYLKGYKWLLSQNQQVRNEFFGYRWYKPLAKHIKPFLKKYYSEKTSVPGLFSKYDQILRTLRIWSNFLKKSLMENFIFFAV